MANAMINGFLSTNEIEPDEIVIFDTDSSKYENYIMLGINTAETAISAVRDAEYTVIAVKPSIVPVLMSWLSEDKKAFDSTTFISIAAAVPIDLICSSLGSDVPVIRTMPSTPMLIGKGAVAICKNDLVVQDRFDYICGLLSSIAEVSVMEESSLNIVISVNGSSPAYVYLFVKAMLDGAAEQGISEQQAMPLILKTIEGVVDMIRQSDVNIETLIERVASPNGTTLAALESLYKDDFDGAVKRAMHACTKRANEISRELRT